MFQEITRGPLTNRRNDELRSEAKTVDFVGDQLFLSLVFCGRCAADGADTIWYGSYGLHYDVAQAHQFGSRWIGQLISRFG